MTHFLDWQCIRKSQHSYNTIPMLTLLIVTQELVRGGGGGGGGGGSGGVAGSHLRDYSLV